MLEQWFKLRGKIEGKSSWIYSIIGFAITICVWWILAELFSTTKPILNDFNSVLPSSIDSVHLVNRDSIIKAEEAQLASATKFEKVYPLLPRPDRVLFSFKDLFQKDKLVPNTLHSIWLNIQGYFWAILLAIPIGLIIGLFPIFNSMFNKQIDSLRYLPLSALTGLFIIWFGLGDPMKIAFLAVGILVYLIPVVVQRIQDLEEVYPQTAYTMGASKWQLIKNIFLPGIFGKLIDDIRVLTAISWTYIIIAELLNKEAGIGSLIYTKSRQGQIDKVFALLIVIIIIGLIQDKLFVLFDRMVNPHKYYKTKESGLAEGRIGVSAMIIAVVFGILCSYFLKINIMCTIAWLLFAAGLLALLYSYFLLSKTPNK